MLKFIFLTILSTIIVFFLWNILRRLFMPPPGQRQRDHFQNEQRKEERISQKVNWDAETIEYEEVQDGKSEK